WLTAKPHAETVFSNMPERTAAMLRFDLRQAKAAWVREVLDRKQRRERLDDEFLNVIDASGKVADFHGLRVSYVTALVKGGASLKVAQELARHSTPVLTLNTYSKLGVHDLSGALSALPAVTVDVASTTLRPTGSGGAASAAAIADSAPPDNTPNSWGANQCEQARHLALSPVSFRRRVPRVNPCQERNNATLRDMVQRDAKQPPAGLEPATCGLQNRCAANCATVASGTHDAASSRAE